MKYLIGSNPSLGVWDYIVYTSMHPCHSVEVIVIHGTGKVQKKGKTEFTDLGISILMGILEAWGFRCSSSAYIGCLSLLIRL